MKKIVFGLVILMCNLLIAQDLQGVKKASKFQLGVHYLGNLRNDNNISNGYNGIVGFSGSYTWYQSDNIALLGGLNMNYLQSRELFFTNNPIIWNPNLSIELLQPKSNFIPYLSVGYAFFNAKFKVMPGLFNPNDSLNPFDPLANDGGEITANCKGITLQSGFKYMLSKGVFLEGSFQYFPAKSNDFDGIVNVHLVKIGVGIKI
jgi:hypothetical protein